MIIVAFRNVCYRFDKNEDTTFSLRRWHVVGAEHGGVIESFSDGVRFGIDAVRLEMWRGLDDIIIIRVNKNFI